MIAKAGNEIAHDSDDALVTRMPPGRQRPDNACPVTVSTACFMRPGVELAGG
ncbi:hypothetical protein [Burkholderia sp. BCC0322]|uniref:hypothetical protein n=1 Tax=unclassified Burkholderia TaxID=2613784 RepID=UPI00158D99D7|nr:hypothetical protein [Burkholderia sp. BCC0322]